MLHPEYAFSTSLQLFGTLFGGVAQELSQKITLSMPKQDLDFRDEFLIQRDACISMRQGV